MTFHEAGLNPNRSIPLSVSCNIDSFNDNEDQHSQHNISCLGYNPSGRPSSRNIFQANFIKLKKYLRMKNNVRKTQIDSVLKKCKSKFFKSIHQVLKKCIKGKFRRLPQKFITNIKIDSNKNYLSKLVIQIYQSHGALQNLEALYDQNLVKNDMKNLLDEFLNLTFKQAYELYTKSEQYLRDYQRIRDKEDDNFAILFYYCSKIFIDYFTLSKGNKKKNLAKDAHTRKFLKTQHSSKIPSKERIEE